jgi:autotransporter-associated beta strand protein
VNGSSLFSARHQWLWIAVCFAVASGPSALALDITGYTTTANDRFASGFPTAPVPNTSGTFVGANYDWSGVGWETGFATKGFGFITPQHYLVAAHYGGAATITLQSPDGTLRSGSQASVTNTGYGVVLEGVPDLSIGRLTASTPSGWQIARYAVLDLNNTSAAPTYGNYNGLSLLAYGRGDGANGSPRVGAATVADAGTFTADPKSSVLLTLRSGTPSVQLAGGDSGSPLLHGWTNPIGGKELTLLGLNSAVIGSYNIMSFMAIPGAMNAANAVLTPDGYALRVAGNLNALWTGSTSSSLWIVGNWNGSPVDQYAGFQSGSSTPTAIDVNDAANIRGLYFGADAGATDGFTFSGSSTLTVGRGGITNYAPLRQTFTANLTLGDHQYWDVGPGGVTAAAINTNGKLLEIAGSGTTRITGLVSGTGGLALSGHRLELTGSSSYTGKTWVHSGTLVVDGNIAASSGVAVDAGATLGGSGSVGALSGAGSVGPGNSPGILTALSVDPSGGLDFSFELTGTGMPNWDNATASVNDVLRLTSSLIPFTSPLSAANGIDIFFSAETLTRGDTFLGGFFTDMSADFLPSVQAAAFSYYVLGNGSGTDKTYNGQGYYLLDTDFWAYFERIDVTTVAVATADFASGDVTNGQVMQFVVVPEPGAIMLAAMGIAIVIARRRSRS